MPVTTSLFATFPDQPADGTLAGLLPPQRQHAGAAVAVLVSLVVLVAWFSPQLLRPSVWNGSGGGILTTFTTSGSEVLTTTLTNTESWTPFTVVEVEDVPGARVVDAWLVTGVGVRAAARGITGTPATAEDYLASVLSDPAGAHLPQRVRTGGAAALLVLWAVDDYTALEQDIEPVIVLRNVVGARTTDTLPSFTAPDPSVLDTLDSPDAVNTSGVCSST